MKKVPKKAITRKGVASRISMYELNRELSAHICAAQKQPLHVYRYSSPCVCIVSADLWARMNSLSAYVPVGHVLVGLRSEIDAELAKRCKDIYTLADRCVSGANLLMVIRAWVLQILHSFSHAQLIRTRLVHDMLWRWFVGCEGQSDCLPDETLFVQDMALVSADRNVIDMIYHCLNDNPLLKGSSELRPNFGLLQALHAEHFDPEPAETEDEKAKWKNRSSRAGYWDMEGFADTENVVFIGTGTDPLAALPSMSVNVTACKLLPGQHTATVMDIMGRK